MIRIVRIEGKTAQGQTQPVVCMGSDGVRCVVKGLNAGRLALIREWLAGNLGTALGLPIPQFKLMELEPLLLDFDTTGYAALIGRITAFGSNYVESTTEVNYSQLAALDPELRARILLFDWWIANCDRTLDASGGNPNMLWDVDRQSLVVIDHNLAFDLELCADFWDTHVFREDVRAWTEQFRSREATRIRGALEGLEDIWNGLPDDWTEVDCGINLEMARDILWRFETKTDTFWRQP